MVPGINFLFLIPTLVVIHQTSAQTYACPSSWTLQDQYCFYKSSTPPLTSSTTWTNAETGCTNLLPNSHLAYFFDNTSWASFQTFRSSASLTNAQLWIGCQKSGASYKWPNGTLVVWSPSGTGPVPSNTYCMSNSDGIGTWISDPGTKSIQYICMVMASTPIIASEIFIYQSATSVSTGTVVKFWGSSFTGQDATTVYQWDFGDGSKSNTTGYNFNASHSYTSASIATPYTVTVNVNNAVSGPVSASNTSQVTVYSTCVIDSCTATSPVAAGTPTEFTIVLSQGSNCDLNIDPKDGTIVVEIGIGSFDVKACNSTTPGCGQVVSHWTKTFNYTYTNASTYNAIANTTNSYGNVVKACSAAVVQDTITGLIVTSPTGLYYAYNVPIVVAFAVTKGSAINFTATIDGTNLTSMTWSSANNNGTLTIMPKDMISVGLKMVTIGATNLVTPTVTVQYSFTIEYPFNQLQYTPVNGYINTTNTAFFTLSWSNATVINCVVDFPGTTAPTTYTGTEINKVIVNYNDTVPTAIPKYSAPGNYKIQVNCSNHISFVNYTILVIAQDPICCLKLSIDYVGSLATASSSTAPVNLSLVWTDLAQPWPTNAKYDYNFIASPAKIGNTYLNQTPQSINYNYSVSDTYVINITVYNLVSTVTFIRTIDIAVKFGNITFDMIKLQPMSGNEPTKYYLQTSEVAQFVITLTQGTLFTYTINFRDGNIYTNSSKFATQIIYPYAYTKAGQYNVTLLIQNAANSTTLLLPYPAPDQYLVVEQSVECFDFTIIEGLEPVIKYVSRMNGTTIHVNITSNSSCGSLSSLPHYSIYWGDSTTSVGNMTDEVIIVPHNYNSSQVYNLNFTIWNEVSTLTASQSIYIYEEVTKVNITVVWVNNTALLPGYYLTSSKGYYPLGYAMHIYAGMIYGNLESYSWKINGSIQPETNKTLIRNFTTVGTYVFFVEIKNMPSGGNSTFTVIIENPTINLNFTDNSPWPLTVEPYHQYSVSMDGVGTDSCYFFDMDDDLPPTLGQKPDCQYLFFGNMQTCSELIPQYNSTKTVANCPLKTSLSTASLEATADLSVDPNDTSTSSLFFGKLNGKSFINFTHEFGNRGAHNVTFIVANHVFNSTIYYRSVVTKGWCSFATVIVNDLNKCQTMENCRCYFNPDGSCTANDVPNGNRVSYFKDQLLIDADVTMNCSSSPDIWFRWTVKLLNLSAKGDVIGNATQFLNGIPYQTFSSKTLVIPAHAMPAGRYLFNLTVSPNDEIDMDRSDTTIVVVEASPIVAQFAGGAAGMHVPQTQQYLFDAWTNSYDPDVDPTNKTGLQFSFYCRRLCETWPPPLPGQTYSSWGGSLDSGCSAATDGTKKGCFGSGPGPLTGGTSNWAVKSGNVTLNTAAMAANVWYSLMVVVSKADTLNPQAARISYAEIFFFVSTANVPTISFNCVTNCQQGYSKLAISGSNYPSGRSFNRVNPTSRFSAEAIIPGFDMATTYLYSWDLIQRPSNDCQANSFSMAKLAPVPDLQWLPNATTGRSIRTISLQSNWYNNDTSWKPGFYLRLSFWINSNTTGPTGQYFYEFFLNDPPPTSGTSVGNCKINQGGVSLSSTFGFVCTNFLDSNNGDMYFYVKQIDQTSYDFWLDIGSNKKSAMQDDTIYVKAVPGPENATKEYESNFKIVVFDSSGSYINVFVNASITPFDINSTYRENAVWSILDYTSTCSMCQIEDFYLQLTKLQRCVDVAAVVRTFSTMLNLNPSTGCQPLVCNNKTAESHNCTIGEEIEVTTMAPVPIPPDIQIQINNSLGPKWKHLGQCQLDLQMRIYLRERLLGAFSTLEIPYFSSFALMLSALYPATVVAQENTIQIMQDVETVIGKGVSHLDGVDPFMTLTLEADTREEICTIITGVVANMERTTNYYGQIWRDALLKYYPQFTMDGLQSEVATLDSMITNNISVDYTTFKFNETNPIWTLVNVNDTLDTATTNDLAIIRFNITLISVVLNRIYKLKNNVTSYVQARKAMGEAPSILTTTNITAVYHKTPVKNMTNFPMQGVGACQFHAANAAEMFGDLNTLEESVMGSIECATNNPFTTDSTSEGLVGTVSMAFQNSKGDIDVANLTKPMDIFLPRTIDQTVLKPLWNTTDTFSSPMVVYSFSLPQYLGLTIVFHTGWIDVLDNTNATTQNVSEAEPATTEAVMKQATTINGSDTDPADTHEPGGSGYEERFVIFFKFWNTFDLENKYDTYCTIPRFDESLYNSTANPNYGDPKSCTVSWNQALAAAKDGDNVLAKSINVFVAVQSFPRGYTMSDFKNTTKISNFNENYFVPVNYTLFAIYSSCMYYDSTRRIWRGDGTDIGPNTTTEVTHCLATHLTSFSTSMNVPMNSLNLQDSAFLHLAENPIAFVFCMCLFCLYIILFVWCRRKDKEDLKKTGIAPLPDNDPRDKYLYQIVFYTASRPNAGTSANIFFQLTGEHTESDVRLAKDSQRLAFRRNGIDTFIMAVPTSLGTLTHLRIWHDNTGDNPSWYLSRFQIMDVQTGEQFFFVVNNWLAVEEGDGHVERIVPVAGKNDLTDFNQLFWQKSQKNLFDGHIWFSVFRRPPRSHFTRVQRLTCCLSLIYCTMVANILFYQVKTVQFDDIILSIGPITVTWTSLKTGIIAALIVAPVNTLLVLLFRYAKPIPIKSPMDEYLENRKKLEKLERKTSKHNLVDAMVDEGSADKLTENTVANESAASLALNSSKIHDNDHPEKHPSNKESELEMVEQHPSTNTKADQVVVDLEPPRVVHIDTRAKKKRFWLPHWVIYIGYALAFVTVGVAFWLIMQIAFGFGKQKALDWVLAMFISLIQSIIFIQPVKIIAMAIVYAVFCKKPEKDEYEPTEIELKEDEVYVHEDMATINDMKNKTKRQAIIDKLKRTRNALPPDLQMLQNAREIRMKEIAMWGLIREMIFYAIFLYTLMMVAYGERNFLTSQMIQNGQNIFILGTAYRRNGDITDFNSIETQGDFFNWAEQILLPGLFPNVLYNTPIGSDQRYIDDGQGYLMGTLRFRQLRIKPDTCKIPSQLQHSIFHCRSSYSISKEDWGQYKKNWVPLDTNNTNDVADDLFSWKNMSFLKENPFIGLVATYWGGGYVADLGFDGETASNILNELKSFNWLDAHTRAVFVEFSVYYPTSNMIMISKLLIEYMSTGGAVVSPNFQGFCLNVYSGTNAVPIIIAEVSCLLFLVYFIYKEITKLIKEKKRYFLSFWNWLEMLVISLLITALITYVIRVNSQTSAEAAYKAQPNQFANFSSPMFYSQLYSWMLYIVLFIANVKFLRLLRFNRRIVVFIETMRYGWKYMIAFFCTFILVFMAFSSAAFIFFGTEVLGFMNFTNTVESLLVVMLNVFSWNEFSQFNRIFGPIFFIVYTLILNFILVNMFLSVVNDSFAVVKSESLEQTNEYELIDFVWNKFIKLFGFGNQVENGGGQPIYAEVQDVVERDLNDCHDKLELLCDRMQDYFTDEHIEEKMKLDWRFKDVQLMDGHIKRHPVISE